MEKIFSIIIPTYNCAKLLCETLDSIVLQDENRYECIIVDGGSTDNTLDILIEYKKKYEKNITYISEADKGVYDAMNKGIKLSEGEYLYFIGAGDTLKENILSEISKHLSFNTEIVYGDVMLPLFNRICGGEYSKEKVINRIIWHQGFFYHKSIFDIMGSYNLKYPIMADTDFNIKCFGNDSISKKYVDLVIANYLGDGLSEKVIDTAFLEDCKERIIHHLGERYYDDYYVESGKKFLDTIRTDCKKAIMIGDRESINFAQNDITQINEKFNRNFKLARTYCTDEIRNLDLDGIDIIFIGPNNDIEAKYPKVFHEFTGEIIETKYFLMDIEFLNYISHPDENVIVFGTSKLSERLFYYLKKKKIDLNILYFLDNNMEKHNKELFGIKVYHPDKACINKNVKILVASSWFMDIRLQLIEMEINPGNIIRVS